MPKKPSTYVYSYEWKEFGLWSHPFQTWDLKSDAADAAALQMAIMSDEGRYPLFRLVSIRTST